MQAGLKKFFPQSVNSCSYTLDFLATPVTCSIKAGIQLSVQTALDFDFCAIQKNPGVLDSRVQMDQVLGGKRNLLEASVNCTISILLRVV